jgi:hypothetical protein
MREAIITMIEVIGTDIIIPSIPQIIPQKARATRTPSGLKLSVLPITFGSNTLPTRICTTSMARNTQRKIEKD